MSCRQIQAFRQVLATVGVPVLAQDNQRHLEQILSATLGVIVILRR